MSNRLEYPTINVDTQKIHDFVYKGRRTLLCGYGVHMPEYASTSNIEGSEYTNMTSDNHLICIREKATDTSKNLFLLTSYKVSRLTSLRLMFSIHSTTTVHKSNRLKKLSID